ncbi:MAG: glycine betaine ABC transporter substrate-binding protein [Ancrocorticia sp.]|uniref:glycine betaine ABC transporter substrate-binding protein n=1 Tax=Ancrocorticia sp. TaxID=2593684 RepID=UPI003F902464
MKKRIGTGALAIGAAAALVLAGCSGDSDSEGSNGSGEESKEITIGLFNWDEAIAVSNLWKYVLEQEGYTVNLETADPGPVFQALAGGDYDAVLDVWLPLTHQSYIDQYGDDIEELGAWNEDAQLTIAVNADAPIDSLTELADNADVFNNQLIGIEPGAGHTEVTEDEVIPTYGLENMEFITSSTPAMLAELNTAMNNGENIAVAMWHPHWAYDAYDIKDLEDPEGSLGEAETLYSYGSATFSEDHPEVAEWISNWTMDSDTLHELENLMLNENDDPSNYAEIIEQWANDNPEYIESMTGGGSADESDATEAPTDEATE